MFEIAIGGLGILVALGVLLGRALDRRAQETAWRNIATARRRNAERRREVDAEQERLWDIADGLDARARRIGSRDRPSPAPPIDRPVRVVEPPTELPDSAA